MILNILVIMIIYAILAISLNLSLGFTGLFNMGHAAFFGIGAYTSALLALAGMPFFISILLGALLAAICGAFLGATTLGLRGDYLCVVTIGFGEIVLAIFTNWDSVTRGSMGLPGIPRPSIMGFQFNSDLSFFILSLIFLLACWFFIEKLVRSPFGRVLRCIREDQLATESIGKDVRNFKIISLTIGSAWAGIAGALYAYYVTFIDPASFTIDQTVLIMLMVILGGMANNTGAVIAAVIIIGIRESARFIGLPPGIGAPIQQAAYSLLLVIIVLVRPNGLFERKHGKKPGSLATLGGQTNVLS
jgi:branched-chain amino acid transport system permease protein